MPSRSARRCRTASRPSTSTSTATTAGISTRRCSSRRRAGMSGARRRSASRSRTRPCASRRRATRFATVRRGRTLRDAYRHAAKSFFPTDGKLPDRALFAAPQYNTWIELMYDQNQRDVLKYAHAIVDNGLPPGVLMIDDNWQEDYGKWTFHPGRFPDPKAMMNELHALGFKVMVWVCPFVSPDCDVYRALAKTEGLLHGSARRSRDGQVVERPERHARPLEPGRQDVVHGRTHAPANHLRRGRLQARRRRHQVLQGRSTSPTRNSTPTSTPGCSARSVSPFR